MKDLKYCAPSHAKGDTKSKAGATRNQTALRPPLPQGHDDVALADINDIKALIRVGSSWVHDAVATGKFPAPAIKAPRFTRWRLADVKAYLRARGQEAV